MYALGLDIGSSSIKCAIFDCESGRSVIRGGYPAEEMEISSPRPGFAEQDPNLWWEYVVLLVRKLMREGAVDARKVRTIGISYQMHGLVLVDKDQRVLRPAIIWCDSRAVELGNAAFEALGAPYSLGHLLNSPGNFTASKLKWVKENQPDIYKCVAKAMLPGDFIAMKLTGDTVTTVSGLSEGIFWDFKDNRVSSELMRHYGLDEGLLPEIVPTFSVQGTLTKTAAAELGLNDSVTVAYRAGDQPNNALSLNVLQPGEIAATAGTSGVVYGVIDQVKFDPQSRVNPFAHVNHQASDPRLGVLLCINGTGILNSWLRRNVAHGMKYDEINTLASEIAVGSDGVSVIPFGNGAERILANKNIGSHILGLDFNRHSRSHILRAAQEGIAFSFRYGIDIMKEMGMQISLIRAGRANMFLSPVFRATVANVTGASIELFETDGAEGAARGAAAGAGLFASLPLAFASLEKIDAVTPDPKALADTQRAYETWLKRLTQFL
ncbi:MAG TPA: FGGY family carbohydrate kinase [Bacteroidota bacterium]|nr:FGGY family carbohydrate kinase [Bacteroidota bacterium]